mgnify:CR=1 FL=1
MQRPPRRGVGWEGVVGSVRLALIRAYAFGGRASVLASRSLSRGLRLAGRLALPVRLLSGPVRYTRSMIMAMPRPPPQQTVWRP